MNVVKHKESFSDVRIGWFALYFMMENWNFLDFTLLKITKRILKHCGKMEQLFSWFLMMILMHKNINQENQGLIIQLKKGLLSCILVQ